MMDAYYRNGELFLNKLGLKKEDLDENAIKNNYIKPAREFLGYSNVGENAKENEVIKLLRRYFEISGKTTSILKSFQTSKNGKCSYCGDEGKVIENKSFIFPFERKVDSIVNENNRLAFCQKCAFTFYSAMAYLYKKRVEDKNLLFFFDSYDSQTLDSVTSEMKKLQDPSQYMEIKSSLIKTAHPYDTMVVTIYEFIKNLYDDYRENRDTLQLNSVSLYMVHGKEQIYYYNYIDGSTFQKISNFFFKIIDESINIFKKIEEKKSKPINLGAKDLVFYGFFNELITGDDKLSEKTRLREMFSHSMLEGKIDFIVLNEILMEKQKNKEKLPLYYTNFINNYMEAFNLDKESFERINSLGYSLGKSMKGTNLENYIWEIFRSRGEEQFLNSLVELQLKLQRTIDLRPINEYENWKEAKAILLNGIVNALYGDEKKE